MENLCSLVESLQPSTQEALGKEILRIVLGDFLCEDYVYSHYTGNAG